MNKLLILEFIHKDQPYAFLLSAHHTDKFGSSLRERNDDDDDDDDLVCLEAFKDSY